ncbi:MAG: ABC transporter substrate-binding protein [Salinisphaera sp.]|jgi:glycerol transport system substrate-binding protein|nr:ABC transporter substrate-binding protein [Salinisphaera sp.]
MSRESNPKAGPGVTRRAFLAGGAALGLAAAAGRLNAAPQANPARLRAAHRWVTREFKPSTLSTDEQMQEMAFFINASRPFRGQRIFVVSEDIPTHVYESRILARAFYDLTGIRVQHDVIREGELVRRLLKQMRTGRNFYDAYVNDSDFIGTHYRYETATPLNHWMNGDGGDFTLPTLDVDDFIGKAFTTAPNGDLYQLPDTQFATLYWFRHDWFSRRDLQDAFHQRYGYELGVPVNWKAYEDIADFFTNHVKQIDGERVYGHMDYAGRSPALGWRMHDSWLAMAGAGSPGLPNGRPVNDWGIRVEDCHAVGSSVARGGATNSPAAVYALRKYLEWVSKYAPPEAMNMNFRSAGPVPGQGHIAQQVFWYSAFVSDLLKPGLPVMNADGTPKWRVAPAPHGVYWEPGMKEGYQDCSSWTLLNSTPVKQRQAAWLYAQFTTCKSVALKKLLAGYTPIRESVLNSEALKQVTPQPGGLFDFYRSPERHKYTPTGSGVPDYSRLAQLWWTRIASARTGQGTPQEVMDNLAESQDAMLARLGQYERMKRCEPRLNDAIDPQIWLDRPGAPKPKLADEEGSGKTVAYPELLKSWRGHERS